MKNVIIFVAILVVSTKVQAQNIPYDKKGETRKYISVAEKSFALRDFATSIENYSKVDSIAPGIPEVECNMGICYLHSRHKAKSLSYFLAAQKEGYAKNDIHYYLGRAYHYNHQFDKAKASFQQYIKLSVTDTSSAVYSMEETKRRILICDYAKEHIEDSLHVSIENVGASINSSFDEYLPILSQDQKTMYFTTRRPTEFNDEIYRDGKHYEDIHISYKNETGAWEKGFLVKYPINDADHDACIGISADANTMFLFRTKDEHPSWGNIYSSKLNRGVWLAPEKLGNNINTRRGWESSISISGDNKRLYFSSDKPGGYGGFDIWYCDLMPNQEWSEAKNMGPIVNTKYNEDCPFIHFDNKTLFFSSDGHNTMGGFDVFTSVYNAENKTWTKPNNIGYPINTVDDDMYFVYSLEGTGFMASASRSDSYGGTDIYMIKRTLNNENMLTLKGKLLNAENNSPLDAKITVTDLVKNQVTGVYATNDSTGKYAIPVEKGKNYSLQFESKDLLFASENINLNDPESIYSENKTFVLKPIKKGNSIVLNNVFFEYNKYDLKKESLPELVKLTEFLNKNKNIVVKINGYTDSIGNDNFNLRLSRKRANEVRNYLEANGIAKQKVRIEGFGETRPKASNATAEGRKMNRYTECQIFDIDTMPLTQKNIFVAQENTESVDVILEGLLSSKKKGALLQNSVIFGYNNSDLVDPLSRKHLEEMADVMKRVPNLKLTVIGNTELVGKEYNNKKLYEMRAKTAIDFLVERGVEKERLVLKPFTPTKMKKELKLDKDKLKGRTVNFALLDI